ncbi:hypothetical protein GCM10010912_57150 [Paenibacillus albidus]|uniref:Cupin type-2 domain-containing protein n=1 Tax=Paenibacillus albidus TaxID=2041023 RepID=A0A917D000_9BACL|nr:cupin domain-containing protein [Paenibacillus albidus]MBT2292406.1 cupin domain-containing protein [Paenibacillus albidus]GGG04991.1 hypothetical protein GCM10010912_57150 [Paenibacillus albidus]
MEKQLLTEAIQYKEERFTKRILFKKDDSVVFVLNFMPDHELPAHTHPEADVYIHALSGAGTITVDGQEHPFNQGEVIHIGGEETFSYRNTGDVPSSLYVVLSKIPSPAYAENI